MAPYRRRRQDGRFGVDRDPGRNRYIDDDRRRAIAALFTLGVALDARINATTVLALWRAWGPRTARERRSWRI